MTVIKQLRDQVADIAQRVHGTMTDDVGKHFGDDQAQLAVGGETSARQQQQNRLNTSKCERATVNIFFTLE